ncbi:MAG: hypothetical protein WA192_03590 [Candidatus Acidiferrales bacterium]
MNRVIPVFFRKKLSADRTRRYYHPAAMTFHLLSKILCISAMFVVATGCAAQAVPPSDQWGDQHNSPGAELTYKETGRMVVLGKTFVTYNLFASGLPADTQYTLSSSIIGATPIKISEVHLNNEGKVLSKLADPAHSVAEEPALINLAGSKGEPFQFAIVSADGQSRAFTRIIPFPFESSAGPCHLSVVQLIPSYAGVLIIVSGLQPNEALVTEYGSEKKMRKTKDAADAKGTFRAAASTGIKGKRTGIFEFNVIAQSCKIAVELPWGRGSDKFQ